MVHPNDEVKQPEPLINKKKSKGLRGYGQLKRLVRKGFYLGNAVSILLINEFEKL